jgi:hypothetical protein
MKLNTKLKTLKSKINKIYKDNIGITATTFYKDYNEDLNPWIWPDQFYEKAAWKHWKNTRTYSKSFNKIEAENKVRLFAKDLITEYSIEYYRLESLEAAE